MFIGHFAVGLGAKRFTPAVSLGTLFLAVQFADLLWPTLVLLGAERFEIAPGITAVTPIDFVSYPYSHSLVMSILWAVIFGGVYFFANRKRQIAALLLGVLVLSHWLLDVATHRPDLPLTLTGDQRVGLGLWNSLPATLAVEMVMFIIGIVLYLRTTKEKNRTGKFAFWGLIAFLTLVNFANMFGPPPPSTSAIAWSAQALWLVVAWGYWIDKNREVRSTL